MSVRITRLPVSNHEFADPTNCYVVESAKRVVLVDTGMATRANHSDLVSRLGSVGLEIEQVTDLLLTHWHADHAGLAETVRETSGATVYIHQEDESLVEDSAGALSKLGHRQVELLESWNVPASKIQAIEMVIEQTSEIQESVSNVHRVTDGEWIQSGNLRFEVVHSPGHTKGHACYAVRTDGLNEMLVGDLVLPNFTPNIGGVDPRVERPLETYLQSLSLVRSMGIETLHPGHGDEAIDARSRIDAIHSHHENRLADIVDVLDQDTPLDIWTVSTRLFGDLEGPHIVNGTGEVYAHLQVLESAGVVERTETGVILDEPSELVAAIESLP